MKVIKEKKKLIVLISVIVIAILIGVGVAVNATGSSGGIAKSVTFSENMDGAYVYFRAVDAAGNVGEWSEPQILWIDTTAPTVTAKESSVTIKQGEIYLLKDYFTVEAKGSNTDISIECTINGEVYEDTESLTVEGSPYRVICTASKNGGNSSSDTMEIVVEPAGPTPWDGTVATGFARGTGTSSDPYIIETPQQLAYLASTVNGGTRYYNCYFKQGADLDLGGVKSESGTWSGIQWVPIGSSGSNFFGGFFDGAGFSIYNLFIDNTSNSLARVGLFGSTSFGGGTGNYPDLNANILIKSGYVKGNNYVGGLAGNADGMFQDCISYVEVVADGDYAGGLFGYTGGSFFAFGCSNYGSVQGTNYVGRNMCSWIRN